MSFSYNTFFPYFLGILHGVHWGLGHGCGELAGGFLITAIGARKTFGIFGTLSLLNLAVFMTVNVLHDKFCADGTLKDKVNEDYVIIQDQPCCAK